MQKNEDYGQKIGGARKDMYDVSQIIGVNSFALKTKALSTVYKLPDLRKMYQAGRIDATQAREARAVWEMVGRRPARGLAAWAEKANELIHYIHGVLVGEIQAERRAPSLAYEELRVANWPDDEYNKGGLSICKAYNDVYMVVRSRRLVGSSLTIEGAVAQLRALSGEKKTAEIRCPYVHRYS